MEAKRFEGDGRGPLSPHSPLSKSSKRGFRPRPSLSGFEEKVQPLVLPSVRDAAAASGPESRRSAQPKIVALLNMSDHTVHVKTSVPVGEPLFLVSPGVPIVFKDYEPFATYTVTIALRNKDVVARRVKLDSPNSHYFSLSAPVYKGSNSLSFDSLSGSGTGAASGLLAGGSKVAPGMDIRYQLKFKPQSRMDYQCDLLCTTEREQFIIPVRAISDRAALDLPPRLHFAEVCPVQHATIQPLLLYNKGKAHTRFSLSCSAPFSVVPRDGYLEAGQSVQVQSEGSFTGQLVATLEDGTQQICQLSASAQSADVFLETTALQMPHTYMRLHSQRSVRLHNKSNIPARFQWSCSPDAGAPSAMPAFQQLEPHADVSDAADSDDELDDETDDEESIEQLRHAQRRARRAKGLGRTVAQKPAGFFDEHFSVEPQSGEIWPGGSMEISISFHPSSADDYNAMAYCHVSGVAEPLPLELRGTGVGPRAAFSYNTLDIGSVYINAVHKYEVLLSNLGEIECAYRIEADESSRFRFSPASGLLAPAPVPTAAQDSRKQTLSKPHTAPAAGPSSHAIRIDFSSETTGEFVETYQCFLQGNAEPLSLTFRGRVIGPTFRFEEKEVDFGRVAYGFVHSREVTLYNTSQIPMRYSLRVPRDGGFMKREFGITPSSGTLLPQAKVGIKIDFLPETAQVYENYYLAIDVDGVGTELIRLPIRAACVVPDLSAEVMSIDFGECFLRHGYSEVVPIANRHPELPAKFSLVPQDETARESALLQAELPGDAVQPGQTYQLRVTLTPQRLGPISVPLYAQVVGSTLPPIMVMCKANSVGPRVHPDRRSLNWATAPVLTPSHRTVVLSNDSPIPAPFKAFLHKKDSVFKVEPNRGSVPPHSSAHLTVTAYLNETGLTMKDTLHVRIHEGEDLEVKLTAKGEGSCIVCPDLPEISGRVVLGHHFTNYPFSRKFTLENRGRRPHVLTWEFLPREPAPAADSKRPGRPAKKASTVGIQLVPEGEGTGSGEGAAPATTQILPEKATLEPGTSMVFCIQGVSPKVGLAEEDWLCRALIGKDNKYEDIFNTKLAANFITPLLQFEPAEGLTFDYILDPREPASRPPPQSLRLTNSSTLPLVFWLAAPEPFVLDRTEFSLGPGEKTTVEVIFNGEAKADKASYSVESHLSVTYRDHVNKDKVLLRGNVCFPNLSFESTVIDFGCGVNQTTKRLVKKITNSSRVPVEYQWVFPDRTIEENSRETNRVWVARQTDAPGKPSSVNQVFGIVPLRGRLEPGQSEDVEFAFYGYADAKVRTVAMCEVLGGPVYEVGLAAEASAVGYRLDKTELNFSHMEMEASETQTVVLSNTGKVPFDYTVKPSSQYRGILKVTPLHGRLNAGEKAKLRVEVTALIPDTIKDSFTVTVAYFEPVTVAVNAIGVFPQLLATLPRQRDDEWVESCAAAQRLLDEKQAQQEREEQEYELFRQAGGTGDLSPRSTGVSEGIRAPSVKSMRSTRSMFSNMLATVKVAYKPPFFGPQLMELHPQLPLHLEADRLHFISHVAKTLEPTDAALATARSELSAAQPRSETKANQPQPQAQAAGGAASPTGDSAAKKKSSAHATFPLARYICDFGNLVAGSPKKKAFKITNVGGIPVSFDIQERALQGSPFTVEPAQVQRLPPGQSAEIVISCQTSSRRAKEQKVSLSLPISIRGGPELRVRVRANINVPDLVVSEPRLEFGDLYPGYKKEITIQLINPKQVPCEWSAKQLSVGSIKDKDIFKIEPNEGVIPVGGRQNVVVSYTPDGEPRKSTCQIPLNISMSDRSHVIKCRGGLLELEVGMLPGHLSLGPVLPFLDSEPAQVLIRNDSDIPLELYSLDFDEQYKREEAAMLADDAFQNGLLYASPRLPGQSLPESVLERFHLRKRANEGAVSAGHIGVRNVLVLGPPLSGRSALCAQLSSELGVPVATIDGLIRDLFVWERDVSRQEAEEKRKQELALEKEAKEAKARGKQKAAAVASSPSPVPSPSPVAASGEPAAEAGSASPAVAVPAEEAPAAPEAPDPARRAFAAELRAGIEAHRKRLAEQAASEAKDGKSAASSSKRAAAKSKPEEVEELSLDFADCSGALPQELITRVLRHEISQGQYAGGIIFDTLDNSFVPASTAGFILRSVLEGLRLERDCRLHVLVVDPAPHEVMLGFLRLMQQCEDLLAEETPKDLKRFKVLPDKEVDKLPGDKREKYLEMLALHEKRARAEQTLLRIRTQEIPKIRSFYGSAIEQWLPDQTQGPAAEPLASPAAGTAAAAAPGEEPPSTSRAGQLAPIGEGPATDPMAAELEALSVVDPGYAAAAARARPVAPAPPPPSEPDPASARLLEDAALEAAAAAASTEAKAAPSPPVKPPSRGRRPSMSLQRRPERKTKTAAPVAEEPPKPKEPTALEKLEALICGHREDRELVSSLPWIKARRLCPPATQSGVTAVPEPAVVSAPDANAVASSPEVDSAEAAGASAPEDAAPAPTLGPLAVKAAEYLRQPFRETVDAKEEDPAWVPPPRLLQRIRQARTYRPRHPVTHFRIVERVAVVKPPPQPQADLPSPQPTKEDKKKRLPPTASSGALAETKKASTAKLDASPAPSVPSLPLPAAPEVEYAYVRSSRSRWVVPARSEMPLLVQFSSSTPGQVTQTLTFEVVGADGQLSLVCQGVCALPEIALDPAHVFARRVRSRKPDAIISHQYVANEDVFDFGPLLIGKDRRLLASPEEPPSTAVPAGSLERKTSLAVAEKRVASSRHTTQDAGAKPKGKAAEPAAPAVDVAALAAAWRETNGEPLRITNTSAFPMHIDLAMMHGVTSARPEEEEGKGGKRAPATAPKPKKKGKGEPDDLKQLPVFSVEPSALDLAPGESRDITVWAFPQDAAAYSDTLVCAIRDNPFPVLFRLACHGTKPALEMNTQEVMFNRLLLGQSEVKSIQLSNPTSLPLRWELRGADALSGAFRIAPGPSGVIAPRQSQALSFEFKAAEPTTCSAALSLHVFDTENVLGQIDVKPIKVVAEAFQVDAKLDLPEGGLDFGTLRVGDSAERKIKFANAGKYEIKFNLAIAPASEALLSSFLTILPKEGSVLPGKEQVITVSLRGERELRLEGNSDLKLHIAEGGSNSVVRTVTLPLTARVLYNDFHVLPLHGISFGAVEVDTPHVKQLKVCNDGHFPIKYRLFAADPNHPASRAAYLKTLAEQESKGVRGRKDEDKTRSLAASPAPRQASSASRKGQPRAQGKADALEAKEPRQLSSASNRKGAKRKDAKDAQEELVLGCFSLFPATGEIPVGGYALVDVTMDAKAPANFLELVEIDIPNRNEESVPRVIYELTGEGCTPGIDTETWDAIFEEQEVRPRLDLGPALSTKNFFAVEEGVFSFAPVVVAGTWQAQADAPSLTERFRISNPHKIPCDVAVQIVALDDEGQPEDGKKARKEDRKKDKQGAAGEDTRHLGFTVSPSTLHIPSLESRYVSVTFHPQEMRSYAARLKATVERGADPKTRQLTVELRGGGTLPRLRVEHPAAHDETGGYTLAFPRVFVDAENDRSVSTSLVLRNDGLVPATARFDLEGGSPADCAFSFSGLGKLVTIDPGCLQQLSVSFRPLSVGAHQAVLRMHVLYNPFESTVFTAKGVGYVEDVTIEGLSRSMDSAEGRTDELFFGDVSVGASTSQTLTLVNHSDALYRVSWTAGKGAEEKRVSSARRKGAAAAPAAALSDIAAGGDPEFTFSPSIAHLPPRTAKTVTVTFRASQPRKYAGLPLRCSLGKIRLLTRDEAEEQARAAAAADAKTKKGKEEQKKAAASAAADASQPFAGGAEAGSLFDPLASDWDSEGRVVRWLSVDEFKAWYQVRQQEAKQPLPSEEEALAAAATATSEEGETLVQVSEPLPEPAFAFLPLDPAADAAAPEAKERKGKAKADASHRDGRELVVFASVTSDVVGFECSVGTVRFRPTLMFQSRSYTFTMRNTSSIALQYRWASRDADTAFTISPAEGSIPPLQEETFDVRFSPLDAVDYNASLTCGIESLPPTQQPPVLQLSGTGQRPICHFELETSDYISSGRRQTAFAVASRASEQEPLLCSTVPAALDASTRVVEFHSLGTRVRNTKRFFVLNPTDESYTFEWRCLDADQQPDLAKTITQALPSPGLEDAAAPLPPIDTTEPSEAKASAVSGASAFRCLLRKGILETGRKCEMTFEFVPEKPLPYESLWEFSIPQHGLSIPVLLVGNVSQPQVRLDRTFVNFGNVLVGRRARETLHVVNSESEPFAFEVDQSTYQSGGAKQVLSIEPTSGTVPANSALPLTLLFRPAMERDFNFNIGFAVRRREGRLMLNVKGEGFAVHAAVHVTDEKDLSAVKELVPGGPVPSAQASRKASGSAAAATRSTSGLARTGPVPVPAAPNAVDFGVVPVFDRRKKKVSIANGGKFSFDYAWSLPAAAAPLFSIEPMQGSVRKASKATSVISFYSEKDVKAQSVQAVLTIGGQVRYVVDITAACRAPAIQLSLREVDFGPCFVAPSPNLPDGNPFAVTKLLTIRNKEKSQSVSVDALWDNKPYLTVASGPGVLPPGTEAQVPITFTPLSEGAMAEELLFEVNGLYKVPVDIKGEGVPLRLELADPLEQNVQLPALRPGQQATRLVHLVNRSRKPVRCSLKAVSVRHPSRPDGDGAGAASTRSTVSTQETARDHALLQMTQSALYQAQMLEKAVSIQPAPGSAITLKRGERLPITVRFAPESRMAPFQQDVLIEVMGTRRRLLTISGACLGVGLRLDTERLAFGAIVANSTMTKTLKISNIGDVGSRFQFETAKLRPHFTISPAEGFVAAHDTVSVDVTFHPRHLSSDIRCEGVRCLIDGAPMEGMVVALTGACIEPPSDAAQELVFRTQARKPLTQAVTITNDTQHRWLLRASIKHEYFTGEPTLEVPAMGKAEYKITYTPLTMTNPQALDAPAAARPAADEKRKGKASAQPEAPKFPTSAPPSRPGSRPLVSRPDAHVGSLLFALPTGKAVQYTLKGLASSPDPEAQIECAVTAKALYTHTLTVRNWLSVDQRFRVLTEVAEREAPVTLQGPPSLDVPASLDRKYKLSFFAFKEGVTHASVRFLNERTGESLLFLLTFNAAGMAELESVPPLTAVVRQTVTHSISLSNPFDRDAVITAFASTHPAIHVPTPITIPARSQSTAIPLSFRPLLPHGPQSELLTLTCPELGDFRFRLQLTASQSSALPPVEGAAPLALSRGLGAASAAATGVGQLASPAVHALPDKTLRFRTHLGLDAVQTFRFTSYATKATVYECKVEGKEFTVHSPANGKLSVAAAEAGARSSGVSASVDVRYEPSNLGEVHDTLLITSPEGGQYRVMLIGICDPPKPQGPFILKAGQTVSIPFRNPLDGTESFSFTVDNPAFVLTKKADKVGKKATVQLTVQFKPGTGAGAGAVEIGRLLVTCPAVRGATWIYYLQGATAS